MAYYTYESRARETLSICFILNIYAFVMFFGRQGPRTLLHMLLSRLPASTQQAAPGGWNDNNILTVSLTLAYLDVMFEYSPAVKLHSSLYLLSFLPFSDDRIGGTYYNIFGTHLNYIVFFPESKLTKAPFERD